MSTKRILITGFGSFPKVEVNPSWEGVNSMKRDEIESKYNVQLYQKKVEVTYDHVDGSVPKLWDEHQPDVSIYLLFFRLTYAWTFSSYYFNFIYLPT